MTPNYTKCASMAYKTIIALKLDTLPIDPLMILMKCKNTVVHTYDEIMPRFGVTDWHFFKHLVMESKDAFTLRKDTGHGVIYELFYDSHARKRRMRFTLAHELGHIILNHRQEEAWEEREADYFAAQLLAPRPVFNAIALYGVDTSNPEFIASTFQLSKAASKIAVRAPLHQPDNDQYKTIVAQFMSCAESIQRSIAEQTGGQSWASGFAKAKTSARFVST